ncbi:MAG TPA: lytic transglycosylase F [Cytophagaceae bacterium]
MKNIYIHLIYPFRVMLFFVVLTLYSCNSNDNLEQHTDIIHYRIKQKTSSEPPKSLTKKIDSKRVGLAHLVNYVRPINSQPISVDLAEIKARGKLVALTGYSTTSYFIYKGTPMGFEYDLLKELANHLDVQLEIVVVQDLNEVFNMLNNGEADIIAHNLTITKERDEKVDFTYPINMTRQVLVQNKPRGWEKMQPQALEKSLIRNPLSLINKEVYVRRESAYYSRLTHLSEEIGGDIKIVEVPGDIETEELISKVASGEIPYTVADENIALINRAYYPSLDISTPISFPQRISWAVRESSPELLKEVNKWIKQLKKQPAFASIYNKYYKSKKATDHLAKCNRKANCGRNISPFDKIISKHAKSLGWDWRLLASLIYQESKFNPHAKSWVGASGLMQLMPQTGQRFGAANLTDPEQSIIAGVNYIKWLDKYWKKKVPDKAERIKFHHGFL